MQNQSEFTLLCFKCTVILIYSYAKFTLADNEKCAWKLMGSLRQMWLGSLGVHSFEVLSLGLVLIFAEQLHSFPACRFLLCHIPPLFKYPKQENPRFLQPDFALLMLNVETTTAESTAAQRLLQKCRGAKPHRDLGLCLSGPSTPLADPDITPPSVSRLTVNIELCTLQWWLPPQASLLVRVNLWWTIYGSLPAALKEAAGVSLWRRPNI